MSSETETAQAPETETETETETERGPQRRETERATVVVRPGLFLTAVIASALGAGGVIYWLLRTMRI